MLWRWVRLAAVLGFLLVSAPAWAKPVARVDDIEGDGNLFLQRPSEAKWYRAHKEMDASLGDHLKTDQKSLATLQFLLGGRANIDVATEVEIVSSKDADVIDSIDLKKGNFWAKFDKQKSPIKIRTAGGVMGIRGTELVVSVDEQGVTTVSLLEGEVEIVPVVGATYMAAPGSKVTFGPDSRLEVVLERVEEMRVRLQKDLSRLSDLEPQLEKLQQAQQRIRDAQVIIESADVVGKLDDMQRRLEAAGLAPKSEHSRGTRGGKILTSWPSLSWPQIQGDRFALMLLPKSGDDVLWLAENLTLPSYTYPDDATPLPAGEYRYRILPLDDKGQTKGKAYEGAFRVAGDSYQPATANPEGEVIVLNEAGDVHDLDASGKRILINCSGSTVNFRGMALSMVVNGSANLVHIEGVASIVLNGASNVLTYSKGQPTVVDNGAANLVQRK